MKKILLLVSLVLSLSGCAGSGVSSAMSVQNDYAAHFATTDAKPLQLDQSHELKVTRGAIASEFYAFIPQGHYQPVASSAGRVFYQAPEGFGYWTNGKLTSQIGGIVQALAEDDSQFYVWFFHTKSHEDFKTYWEMEPNSDWIDDVKPGIRNIETRPWVESEMLLQLQE